MLLGWGTAAASTRLRIVSKLWFGSALSEDTHVNSATVPVRTTCCQSGQNTRMEEMEGAQCSASKFTLGNFAVQAVRTKQADKPIIRSQAKRSAAWASAGSVTTLGNCTISGKFFSSPVIYNLALWRICVWLSAEHAGKTIRHRHMGTTALTSGCATITSVATFIAARVVLEAPTMWRKLLRHVEKKYTFFI